MVDPNKDKEDRIELGTLFIILAVICGAVILTGILAERTNTKVIDTGVEMPQLNLSEEVLNQLANISEINYTCDYRGVCS